MKPKKDNGVLKRFMKEFFPFNDLLKAGFFTPEMKGDYEAQAKRVCEYFGFETVYEYGSTEISCHLTYSKDARPPDEGFVTVIPSIYE